MSSPHTTATYERSISTLRKSLAPESTGYSFLSDYKSITSWIDSSKYALNSKKTIYIALVSVLKKECLIDSTLLEASAAYRAKMDSLNSSIKDAAENQELSETEKAKYLVWPEVMATMEKIRLAVDDLWSFQHYLICALYCMMPPVRLDYAMMKVVYEPQEDTDYNYLVLSDKPYFVLNRYKTQKCYGAQVVALPPELCDVIYEWRSMVDDECLLLAQNGSPMLEWQLGQTITEMFKKHSGKAAGVNILRHSYISDQKKGEMALKASQVLAQSMMHSPQMSQLYRKI
jgi:hypothetical protein